MESTPPQGPVGARSRVLCVSVAQFALSLVAGLGTCGCGDGAPTSLGGSNAGKGGANPVGLPTSARPPVRRLDAPDAVPRRVREAVQRAVAQVESAATDARAHGELAMLYEANGLWAEALSCYGTAASLDVSDPMWVLHGSYAYAALGQQGEALTLLRDTAGMYVQCAPLQQQLGDLAYEAGDAVAAQSAYRAARSAAPGSVEPLVGLAQLALDAGRAADAAPLLEQVVASDPRYRAARFLLGSCYRELGRLEDAERETRLGSGGARRRMRDRLSERIEAYEFDLERIVQRATGLLDARRPDAALALLERHASAFPKDARIPMNAGNACLSLGRAADAIAWYDKALALAPDQFLVHVNRSNGLLTLGRADEARAAAQRALDLSPSHGASWLALARAHEALGSAPDAEAALRRGVELDPRNPALRQALAQACTSAGKFDEALEHARVQAELVPQEWRVFAQLALAAADARQGDEARAALAKTRELAPADPDRAQVEAAVLELLAR
ncbi:MAG: tetratricopeptide repeat protein [Planctomycetes bacterium]|nr:tetratricopeptide repeat protein [Planctomycetota bacterium]